MIEKDTGADSFTDVASAPRPGRAAQDRGGQASAALAQPQQGFVAGFAGGGEVVCSGDCAQPALGAPQ